MRPLLLLTLALTSAAAALRAQVVEVLGSEALAACYRDSDLPTVDSTLSVCLAASREAGYLEASIDSVRATPRGDTLRVYAYTGPLYRLGAYASRVDTSAPFGPVLRARPATPTQLGQVRSVATDYLDARQQQGYPFARVRFDSLHATPDSALHLSSTAWSGPRITYGGVRWVGAPKSGGAGADAAPVSARYLERALRIEPGRLYRDSDLRQVERRLRGLGFLTLGQAPVVVFEDNRAYVYVDAKARKTSRFDFLLGFLPNSEANEGQLLLTGDLTLELENALRRGERLFFNFERLQPEATEVQLEASYPYVLDSPFGGRGAFNLYRQQDEWLRLNYEAGGTYALGGADALELYYEGGQAQVLGFDTLDVLTRGRLPDVLDASRNGFGTRLRLDRRDDAFDTRRGYRLVADVAAAVRAISVPTGIRALGEAFGVLADSIEGPTAQYRASLDAARFFQAGRRGALVLQLRAATLFGEQTPLRNELYRIGGNRLLRGFDEQTIDAQHYGVATAEYRLLIGGGSYAFVFADQGILVDPYRSGRDVDQPTGFGGGLRLGTGGGALSLTYAYGRRNGAPIDWQRAKVHVGFASRF